MDGREQSQVTILLEMILLIAATNWLQVQQDRWHKAEVRPEKAHFVQAIAAQIERNKARYVIVSKRSNVPWEVVASLHSMEASLSFRTHLHNGDPITAPTRHVPKNRPNPWSPPVSWEDSATDALSLDRMGRMNWSDVAHKLNAMEGYNGTGYQRLHPEVPTPYLWAWSTIEKPGKFIEDGVYSTTARSQQAGAAMILKDVK